MTQIQTERLAQIRGQMEKWIALKPDAVDWDSSFLLALLDLKNQQVEELQNALLEALSK